MKAAHRATNHRHLTETQAAVETAQASMARSGGGYESDDLYAGFEGGDGGGASPSVGSPGGLHPGQDGLGSQSPWRGEDPLAAALSDGGDPGSPGHDGLSYTGEIDATIEAEAEIVRPKSPLVVVNDDGEEIELESDSGCDSIADSNYQYGSDSY